jgi:predicted DNA-binding protein (MmcQ/YjbR family)
MDAYRKQPGILPGYHMNKDHWITILLDGSADDVLIKELFEISYDMTDVKPRIKKCEADS